MVSIDTVATGQHIKTLIKDKNITVKELQNKLCFSTPQAIYKWLRGVMLPSVDNLFHLADILDCTVDEIVVRRK